MMEIVLLSLCYKVVLTHRDFKQVSSAGPKLLHHLLVDIIDREFTHYRLLLGI